MAAPSAKAGIVACCAFVFMLLCGCTEKKLSNVEYGNQNQILFYGNGDEPKSLDPHLTTGSPDNNIIINLFEGLLSKDHATLEPKPGVAKSWTISEDGRVYRFRLREEARWSNGDPLTAEDFVYSWRRALTPSVPNAYAYMMYYIEGAEDFHTGKITDFAQVGVKALSAHELEVTLIHPAHFFLQLLDHHSYYPVHGPTLEKFGGISDPASKWTLPGNLVGNGPFVLKSWEINKVIELEKSETYWDKDAVKLRGAHFFPIDDQQGEERAFRTGQIHLTNTPQMDIEKIETYRKKDPDVLRVVPTYASYYYEFNVNRKPFDDARVRKAFALAVDRKLIVEKVTKGGEVSTVNFVPPDPAGYQPQVYWQEDVEEARRLLAEAGYPDGKNFPAYSLMYNTHDNHQKVALAVQQMLKKNLNIDIQLENKEWKVYMMARKNLEHDIVRAGWVADYMDPSNFFDILRSYSGNNNTGWKNAQYDQLMNQIAATSDTARRNELFEEANRLLAEEMPVLPLYYYSDLNLVHTSVQGWYDNAMHYHPLKHVYLQQPTP
jgi:ABC-type oligopeptide transport system, periplasmic component